MGVGGRLFWRLYLGWAHGRASDELEPADRLVGGTTAVKLVACCLLGTISCHSILDQNFRGKNPRERESTAGSGLVLGLIQSITVPYLGSYKLVGEVGEF